MRFRYALTVAISSTSAEERDLGNNQAEVVVDTIAEGGTQEFTVPASTTNAPVQHPQLAAGKFVYLRTRAVDPNATPVEITVKKNSTSGEAWNITPLDGKEGHFLISTSGLTALYLSNPGLVAMKVTVAACGD
jgi:hypothetical protein